MKTAVNYVIRLGEGSKVKTTKECWGENHEIPPGSIGILLGIDIDPACVNVAFDWGADTIDPEEAMLVKHDG